MYQIAFPRTMLAAFLPWLMLNRNGLTVLLHPETGNALADHTDHAAWLGGMLPLTATAILSQHPLCYLFCRHWRMDHVARK